MRVLFLADLAYPDHAGGSHRCYYELAIRLAERGHEVHLITGKMPDSPDTPHEELIDGVLYHRLDRDRRNFVTHGLSYVLGARRVFASLTRQEPFDIISAHYVLPTMGILSLFRGRRTPIVYDFHGPWAGEFGVELQHEQKELPRLARLRRALWMSPTLGLVRLLERQTYGRAVRLHAESQFMADMMADEYGVPRRKIVVIPAGVDTDKFAPPLDRSEVRRQLGLPLRRPLLLTVRRLYARMGLENLVLAMRTVAVQRPEVLLLIGGTGPLHKPLQTLIERSGLTENVRLLGYVEEEQLPLYYQAADLFVLPTLALEGFGLVTVESLACGTPAVGTPIGGTIEILGGLDNRLLLASTKPDDVARGILDFLAAPTVSRETCRQYVLEHYSWDKTTQELEGLFRTVSGAG